MAVRGHDKENRAIIIKLCREGKWSGDETADEGYQLAQSFIAERAIAATETRSIGTIEQITLVFDLSAYSAANAPPVKVMIETIKILQAKYPERLGKVIVLDAMVWMQAVLKVINPFLVAKTREKLVVLGSSLFFDFWPLRGTFPSSAVIREESVRTVVHPDQAMPFMLPDAKLISAIDVVHLLRQVPFYELYDYTPPSAVTL